MREIRYNGGRNREVKVRLSLLRRTAADVEVNMAYRWFLGYGLREGTPHFSTLSYNCRHRFTSETSDEIFAWMLNDIAEAGYLSPETDAENTKAIL